MTFNKIISRLLVLLGLYLSVFNLNATTFKIATTAPDGTLWMKEMRNAAKEIKKITEGRVKFKFYPGGVMGSEEITLKKIKINQLQGTAVSHGVLERFYPDSQIYALPMLFKDFKEVDLIRDILDKQIIDGLEESGMISFGFAEGGFAYAMSTKPIRETDELLKHKVWTPANNNQAEMILKSFDISPIPLNLGDVHTGLQTNIIDTVAVSPIVAIALQWHTQVKYITNIPLAYIYATLLIEKGAFNKLNQQDQLTVRKLMTKAFETIDRQNRIDNHEALSALLNQGLELVNPEVKSMASWDSKGEKARENIENSGNISPSTLKKVKQILEKSRNQQLTQGAAQ